MRFDSADFRHQDSPERAGFWFVYRLLKQYSGKLKANSFLKSSNLNLMFRHLINYLQQIYARHFRGFGQAEQF